MVQVEASPLKKSNKGKGKGKQKVVDEGSGLKKYDKRKGKQKVVDEGSGLQKYDKGKGKQKVVNEVSDSWSDEISNDSDENFECLVEEVFDDSDDDIQTVPEKRTDDSDEEQQASFLSWVLIPIIIRDKMYAFLRPQHLEDTSSYATGFLKEKIYAFTNTYDLSFFENPSNIFRSTPLVVKDHYLP
ncbi:hypothetical protein VNO77_44801 [Canavalia gladiata]|uniref:Uncharacterized protein n=1 Tax=Canavalia gladiata TaxID=3824 RepID=A0AAN9JZ31_CANGL